MTIHVQCYAGHCGEQEPRAFVLGEQPLDVLEIRDRWLAPAAAVTSPLRIPSVLPTPDARSPEARRRR